MADPSTDDIFNSLVGAKTTPATPPAPSKADLSTDDIFNRITGAKAAPAPPRAGVPAAPDAGGVAPPATPSAPLSDQIATAEKTNDIPPGLLNQVLTTESGLKPGAMNIQGSGATGIAQIKPATAADPGYGIKPVNPNDPADSIRFAGQYLAALKKKTGSWAEAVKAYGTVGATAANEQQARTLALAEGADQPSPLGRFSGGYVQAQVKKPGLAADVWQNFLTGMGQVPKIAAKAYAEQEAAQEKAGISPYGPLSPIAPAFQAVTAAGGQAMGTVFNSAIETALAFAKDAGMDEAGLTRLRGDITQFMEVSQAAIPESGGELGRLHGEIKTTLEERAPPGTAEAFDKASIPPTDRGPGITVHHGSPHQFQQFDTAKIGTGEGQQARGHGFYFAESPDVAKSYADGVKPGEKGHVYTSTIHGHPDEFLHLDKPLSEQSPHVKDAIEKSPEAQAAIKRLGGDPTGEQVYRAMAEDLGGGPKTPMAKLPEADARASAALKAAGIKGNRYLDAGSRGVGQGTHNYVVFDHGDVSITHVNGEHLADIVARARGGPPAGEPPFAGPPPGEPPAEPPPRDPRAVATDLHKRLREHMGGVTADRAETVKTGAGVAEAIPDAATREKLIHYQEQPDKIQITPEEKGLFDKHILPIIRATEAVRNKIADLLGLNHFPAWPAPRAEGQIISQAPRFTKDKGSTIDWLLHGIARGVGRGGLSTASKGARTILTPMIENPKVAYYKDVVVNNLVELESAKRQLRNLQLQEHIKGDPDLAHLRVPAHSGEHLDWHEVNAPQLRGYRWEPKIAAVLNDFFKDFKRSGDGPGFLDRVNRFIVGAMFYKPWDHLANMFNDFLVGKGLVGLATDLPGTARDFARAFNDVRNLSPEYIKSLRSGSSLQYGAAVTENFIKFLTNKLAGEVKANPSDWLGVAQAFGYADPVRFVAAIFRASRRGMWFGGDVLKQTAQYGLERGSALYKGVPKKEAVHEAEKHIVNYDLPSEILHQRWLSQLFRHTGFMFSRYHYGQLRGLGITARDLVKGTPRERMKALDSVAMMGVLYLGYNYADQKVRELLGNKNAYVRRYGIFGYMYQVEQMLAGNKDPRDVIQRAFSPGPLTELPVELLYGINPYTGKSIIRGADAIEHPQRWLKEVGQMAGRAISPVNEILQMLEGSRTPKQILEQQVGIIDPDPRQVARTRIARLKADRALQRSLRRQFGD